MRIGIDAHILGKNAGGVERVVHEMVRLLPGIMEREDFIIFTNKAYDPPFESRPNVRYCRLPVADPLLQRSLVLPWLARRERLDLLHVQRAAPRCVRARLIVHMHDLLHLTAPADHRGFRDQLIRNLTPSSLRRAEGVLTVSESAAAEIRSRYPFAASKLTSIHNGVDADKFRPKTSGAPRGAIHARLGITGPYFLYVGALMSRKNLEVAIRGFSLFLEAKASAGNVHRTKLVLAGMSRSNSYVRRLRELADKLAPEAVCFAGFVSEEECLSLLQHASVFLAPSRGEGFDLPPLEAMACSIPVVCSELPVHRELLADDALYFETDQPAALADQLLTIECEPDLGSRLAMRGPLRAARFSWGNTMSQMAEFYYKVHASTASHALT